MKGVVTSVTFSIFDQFPPKRQGSVIDRQSPQFALTLNLADGNNYIWQKRLNAHRPRRKNSSNYLKKRDEKSFLENVIPFL